MKGWQEYAIVVVLGIIVSLIATLFIFLRVSDTGLSLPTPVPVVTPVPVTELPDMRTQPIQILAPANEAVFDSKALTIRGEASPSALVVVFVNDKNFVVPADNRGRFSLDINLESGSNAIKATMVDELNREYTDSVLVVYTNKSLEEILLSEEELEEVLGAHTNEPASSEEK